MVKKVNQGSIWDLNKRKTMKEVLLYGKGGNKLQPVTKWVTIVTVCDSNLVWALFTSRSWLYNFDSVLINLVPNCCTTNYFWKTTLYKLYSVSLWMWLKETPKLYIFFSEHTSLSVCMEKCISFKRHKAYRPLPLSCHGVQQYVDLPVWGK